MQKAKLEIWAAYYLHVSGFAPVVTEIDEQWSHQSCQQVVKRNDKKPHLSSSPRLTDDLWYLIVSPNPKPFELLDFPHLCSSSSVGEFEVQIPPTKQRAFFFVFLSTLWCSHTGDHLQEELARFGNRSDKKEENSKSPVIFWRWNQGFLFSQFCEVGGSAIIYRGLSQIWLKVRKKSGIFFQTPLSTGDIQEPMV